MSEVTAFQRKVYAALKSIPSGRVTTYKELSIYLHCNSAQAIGQALKRNPFAPQVPCHRVIKTDLSIGGYIGADDGKNLNKKRALLEKEGVFFKENGKLLREDQLFQF